MAIVLWTQIHAGIGLGIKLTSTVALKKHVGLAAKNTKTGDRYKVASPQFL